MTPGSTYYLSDAFAAITGSRQQPPDPSTEKVCVSLWDYQVICKVILCHEANNHFCIVMVPKHANKFFSHRVVGGLLPLAFTGLTCYLFSIKYSEKNKAAGHLRCSPKGNAASALLVGTLISLKQNVRSPTPLRLPSCEEVQVHPVAPTNSPDGVQLTTSTDPQWVMTSPNDSSQGCQITQQLNLFSWGPR